jgi:hypothetical protein
MKRYSVNKSASARKFSRQHNRVKAANTAPPPFRGGYRL